MYTSNNNKATDNMPNTILNGSKKINFNNIKCTPPKPLAKGKVVNVKMDGGSIRITSPKMLHWGASDYEGDGKFKLHLQFPSDDNKTDATNCFLDNMQGLYNAVLKVAADNSKDWFGKQVNEDTLRDDKLHPFLSRGTSADGKATEPVMRVKFNKIRDSYTSAIYNEDREELWAPNKDDYDGETPMQHFQKGGHAVCILEVGGITIINGKAYIGINLFQSVAFPNPNQMSGGGCLIGGDDDSSTPKKNEIDTAVESSDDEEEEVEVEEEVDEEEEPEPEPEPQPEPPKAVKKKVIKKKA